MSDAGSPPPGGGAPAKKRRRAVLDTSLIIDEPRKRKRREGSADPAGGAAPMAPHERARVPEEFEEVRQRGMILYDKLIAQTDPYDSSRPLWYAFGELPPADQFPDYYAKIKKPISLKEIKDKLDRLGYVCLLDVKTDLNQIFVNAKRYNAPKSALFMDAKRLHKTLKETYAILTGEAPPPEDDDDGPGPSSSAAYPNSAAPTSDDIHVGERADGPGRRSAVLKPWLSKKLHELLQLTDQEGRSRSQFFLTLPSKQDWPDYYQVIANPLAFDNISTRIKKGAYSSVEKFVEDVNTIFANAFQFNEDSSLVCHNAGALRSYFAQLMQEPPPADIPARKPAAPRSGRRGSSAQPTDHEEDDEDDGGSEYGGGGGGSRYGSVPPQQLQGYDAPSPYGASPAAGSPAMVGSGYTPTTSTIGLPSLGTIPEVGGPSLAANPLAGLASLAGAAGLNGVTAARPVASRSVANEVVYPRTVVKLPAAGEVPLVTRFNITFHPSSSASSSSPPSPSTTTHLDTSSIRQHSLSLPYATERVTFTPIFRSSADFLSSSSDLNGKGKGKAANCLLDVEPTVTVRTKPSSVTVSSVVVPAYSASAGGPAAEGQETKTAYALTPRRGLNVVEFVVKPANADLAVGGDGEEAVGEEVYRVFVTKWGEGTG